MRKSVEQILFQLPADALAVRIWLWGLASFPRPLVVTVLDLILVNYLLFSHGVIYWILYSFIKSKYTIIFNSCNRLLRYFHFHITGEKAKTGKLSDSHMKRPSHYLSPHFLTLNPASHLPPKSQFQSVVLVVYVTFSQYNWETSLYPREADYYERSNSH